MKNVKKQFKKIRKFIDNMKLNKYSLLKSHHYDKSMEMTREIAYATNELLK